MNNLFKIKHKPAYFFNNGKWIQNNDFLNEDDVVTQINDLSDDIAKMMFYWSAVSMEAADLKEKIKGLPGNNFACDMTREVRVKFFDNFDSYKTEYEKINLIKENFKIYLTNTTKTIIWKEFLEEIPTEET